MPPVTRMALPDGAITAMLVLGAGMVGGLASWIIQQGLGVQGFGGAWPWYQSVPAVMILGAIAAALGVYLIANSDTTRLRHTLAFALACGIFWQPVIESARAFINQSSGEMTASDLGEKTAALQESVRAQSGDIDAKVTEAGAAAAGAVGQVANVADFDVRQDLLAKTRASIPWLTEAADRSPQLGIKALQDVAVQAVQAGQADIATDAVGSLRQIGSEQPNPAVAMWLARSFDDIAKAAEDGKRPGLAADARVGKADVLLKTASANPGNPAIAGEWSSAKIDLKEAEQFYRVTGEPNKADSAVTMFRMLEKVQVAETVAKPPK